MHVSVNFNSHVLISTGNWSFKKCYVYFSTIKLAHNGRFLLRIRSTQSSPIKRSGTDRARSAGVVGVVYLSRHRSCFLPEKFGHVQKIRVEIEKPSAREAIGK